MLRLKNEASSHCARAPCDVKGPGSASCYLLSLVRSKSYTFILCLSRVADYIVLNKIDLLDTATVESLTAIMASLNPLAQARLEEGRNMGSLTVLLSGTASMQVSRLMS